MNENQTFEEIDIDDLLESVGYQFLDFLVEEKMVTESFSKKIKALTEIEMSKMDGEILTESDDVAHYTREGIQVPGTDVIVPYETFKQVWEDPDNYETRQDIFVAFNVSRSRVQSIPSNTIGRYMLRMVNAYNTSPHNPVRERLVKFGRRARAYGKKPETQQDFIQEPTQNDIFGGSRSRRNQTTVTLDRVNAQELLAGELYSNRSRIPRQRWSGWLRFWDRRLSRVKPNRGLIGRKWEKHFLMGYQIDRNVLFEIWYNTLDSSFSIHDQNGIELGRPVETLQEAMKYFVRQITTASDQDAEIFTAGGVNNQVANSMLRGVSMRLSSDAAEAEREAQLRLKSAADMADAEKAVRAYNAEKVKKTLRRKDRIQSLSNVFTKAMEIPVNLQRSAYIRMMNTSSDLSDKISIALRASFEYAVEKAKDERELQGILASQLRDYLKDDIESGAEIMRIAREYVKDPKVRAEINKRMSDGSEEEEERRREEIRNRLKDAEAKFRAANEEKRRKQEEQDRKARERAEARGKKALGQKYNVLDRRNKRSDNNVGDDVARARSNKQADAIKAKYRKNIGISESFDALDDTNMAMANQEIDELLDSRQMDQQVTNLRNMAERSPYTQAAITSSVMSDMLRTYQTTRAPSSMGQSRFFGIFHKEWARRHRKILPNMPMPRWERMKQKLLGRTGRADFVIGYTFDDKVNIEIWYVTEWSPEEEKMVSSFHVFDVSAAKVVRRYLPYYRTAVMVALSKIGLQA